jgi:GT2 family glycosyltransferase
VTFWEHFLRLLPRRPKAALAALYWHVTRRRVRARNLIKVASADLPFAYALWMETKERNSELIGNCRTLIEGWSWQPRFAVLLYSGKGYSKNEIAKSRRSIDRQVYSCCQAIGPFEDSIANGAQMDADYLIPLRVGDELSRVALFRFAEAAQSFRGASIFYGDEDRMDDRGRRSRPWFKPRWNEEMFLALDYVSNGTAIEANLFRKLIATGPKTISAVVLSATAAAEGPIVHIPHILYHASCEKDAGEDRVEAVGHHLAPLGGKCGLGPYDTVKVEWPLPRDLPLVTVIVPTRDKLELLRPCVEGVLGRTDYGNFELLIIDNGSIEQRTADYLQDLTSDPRVRIVSYPAPYNFSAMNNFGVRHAAGTYVCLLNNDTEVIEPAWLSEMMRYAVRPDIGAVGAKLLYEDGSIQHAGVVVGIGDVAGHAHRYLPQGEPGYFRMAHVAQFVSAVTAACLVIDKSKFEAVGGLDEQLAVAFNDVDFCLKVEAAGWRNVYVPHAVLVHHESKTRGSDMSPEQIDRYYREVEMLQDRWGTKSYVDPQHNPNLDRYNETFIFTV